MVLHVAALAAVVVAAFFLENHDLVVAIVLNDLGLHGRAGNKRGANFVANHDDIVQRDGFARIIGKAFNGDFIALGDAVLFSAGFNDCVHGIVLEKLLCSGAEYTDAARSVKKIAPFLKFEIPQVSPYLARKYVKRQVAMAQGHVLTFQNRNTDIWYFEVRDGHAEKRAANYVMPAAHRTMRGRTAVFRSPADARGVSILAQTLLMMDGVERVAMGTGKTDGRDFVTITYKDNASMKAARPKVEARLVQHAVMADKTTAFAALVNLDLLEPEKDIVSLVDAFERAGNPTGIAEIKAVISIVNRSLASHGGEAEFTRYDASTRTLGITLKGNCDGCAASAMTIEQGLKAQFQRIAKDMANPVERIVILPAPAPRPA